MSQTVFRPFQTVIIATSTTSAAQLLPIRTTHVRFYNPSTTIVWIEFGEVSPTAAIPANGATDAGFAVAPGATENFSAPTGVGSLYVAAILPAGASASTLHITCGEGE